MRKENKELLSEHYTDHPDYLIAEMAKVMRPIRYRGVNIHPVPGGFKVLGSELPTMYLAKKKVDSVYDNLRKAVSTLSNAH